MTAAPRSGSSSGFLAAGCGIAGLLAVGLCIVPVVIWRAIDLLGSRVAPPPIAPIVDPLTTGMGEGGPRMPMTAEAMRAEARAETKVVDLEVTALTGGRWARPGDRCRVEITFDPASAELACRASVRCGETLAYGGESLGYFECERGASVPDLRLGEDLHPSSVSEDAMLSVGSAEVRVSDEAGGALGAFELVLSRTAPPAGPPADTIWVEPIFVPDPI